MFDLLNSNNLDSNKFGLILIREFLCREFNRDNHNDICNKLIKINIEFSEILFEEIKKILFCSNDSKILVIFNFIIIYI